MKKVSVIIVGGGGRGTIYAQLLREISAKAEVVAVAEPRDFFRNRIAQMHGVPAENSVSDWRELAARPKFADAVIIATQDRMHLEPALAFAEKKYHILLEKPLATDLSGCRELAAAAEHHDIVFSVCHVLRYTEFTRKLKSLIAAGEIGKILSVQHLEPVGHWRFAHSFVRGSWRREEESSSVLLSKSTHDLDWIRYIVDAAPKRVSSFGSLIFFKKENRPANAAARCLDCAIEAECPYSAPRFYLERIRSGDTGAYVESVTGTPTEECLIENLRTGPYGRCVFACDNDVADHQVVNVEFENGATAAFTLAGCSKYGDRRVTIFGSLGEIYGDGERLSVFSYLTGTTREIDVPAPEVADRHGGGDFNLLNEFINAVRTGDRSGIVSGAEISLETHALAFAAELSRKEHRVVEMKDFL
ncbi:MAG: Gfo/Idh/MocA family oxidoreductase [Opitutales bacterium]|nr:Gfo/Idh/MocA family oxidoreductase [Opitutales bacterium]